MGVWRGEEEGCRVVHASCRNSMVFLVLGLGLPATSMNGPLLSFEGREEGEGPTHHHNHHEPCQSCMARLAALLRNHCSLQEKCGVSAIVDSATLTGIKAEQVSRRKDCESRAS